MENPLLKDNLVPAYDKIKPAHFEPAIDAAIAQARTKFETLRNDNAVPSFKNTAIPLESLFEDIGDLFTTMSVYNSSVISNELISASTAARIKLNQFVKTVFQDQTLAGRFKTVYDAKDSLSLDEEDEMVLNNIYRDFEESGAFATPQAQKRIKDIDDRLITLCKTFSDNLIKSSRQQAFLITDKSQFSGLSDDFIDGMEAQAQKTLQALQSNNPEDKEALEGFTNDLLNDLQTAGQDVYLFMPERLKVDDMLTIADNRSFRENILKSLDATGTQAPYDNRPLIKEIQTLRQERTELLDGGYRHYADFALKGTMAATYESVCKMFDNCVPHLLKKFDEDMKIVEDFASQNGGPQKLEPWDSVYWAEKYKQATFAHDSSKLSEYLEMDVVLDGMFDHFGKLFDLDYKENSNYPVPHPDFKTYDVFDKETGEHKAVLYIDPYERPGTKSGGAWMNDIQREVIDENGTVKKLNLVSINMNCARPKPGNPTLVPPETVETWYHEAGHAHNAVLGSKTKYRSLQGTGISSDFVEIHSTIQENWALARDVLKGYAKHWKNKDVIPDNLIDAMEQSDSFLATRNTLKVIQNSLRDFKFHTIDPKNYVSDTDIEDSVKMNSAYVDHLRAYPLSRFLHLFSAGTGGYAAGYYGYHKAYESSYAGFEHFKQDGLYNKKWAKALKTFNAEGSRRDPNRIYETFNGGSATADAMLRALGVTVETKPEKNPGKKGPQNNGPT